MKREHLCIIEVLEKNMLLFHFKNLKYKFNAIKLLNKIDILNFRVLKITRDYA